MICERDGWIVKRNVRRDPLNMLNFKFDNKDRVFLEWYLSDYDETWCEDKGSLVNYCIFKIFINSLRVKNYWSLKKKIQTQTYCVSKSRMKESVLAKKTGVKPKSLQNKPRKKKTKRVL